MPLDIQKPLQLPLSQEDLHAINAHLAPLFPEDILKWGIEHLPALYQTTALGLTGLAATDMLSKLSDSPPPLIFLDTLYHFPETYELLEDVKKRYKTPVHVFKPEDCDNVQQFEEKYGQQLWELDDDTYDYLVKVRFYATIRSTVRYPEDTSR
jgi:phosphoadenosine phosphosulfate reductase